MDGTNPVGLPGKPQGQNGHTERLPLLVHPRTPQFKQLFKINLTFADIGAEVFFHHLRIKGIVSCRHRRVGGEKAAGRHVLQGFNETELLLGDQHPDPLQAQKRGVALVHVKDRRLQSHRSQRLHPADAEDDFLADPHVMVSTIELISDVPVVLGIFRQVSIEQEKTGQSDIHLPSLGSNLSSRHIQFHHHRSFPVGGQSLSHGKILKYIVYCRGFLPSLAVDLLGEIPKAVQQAQGDERKTQITG